MAAKTGHRGSLAARRLAQAHLTKPYVRFATMQRMIHHVQLACPPGSEEASRAFYSGILRLTEKPKPPALAARGGCWFTGEGIELHLGVEKDFRPARKAHPGLLWPALDELAERLTAVGYPVVWGDDEIPGMRRFHTHDVHGNRLEFLTPEASRAWTS